VNVSWIPAEPESDFPLANLPYGAFSRDSSGAPRLGVALGASIIDLHMLAERDMFEGTFAGTREVLVAPNLNPLLARGATAWRALRARLQQLLAAGNAELRDCDWAAQCVVAREGARMHLPIAVGDYVDFYSSLEHATNLGKILRPGSEPLLPNWRWLPIGYHGRAGTIVIGGTPIVRPNGQRKKPEDAAPEFGPSRMLDFELELAFVTGEGPSLGRPVAAADARELIFGVVLLNDWSARDIQGWEYQPLGPFLGKSFATSLGPWVVPLEALEDYRVAGPEQQPPALPYLATTGAQGYDIGLTAALASAGMRAEGAAPDVISRTNFRDMYWSMPQQLAHAASNGAGIRAGDLFGSGTISGSAPGSYGSMIELTWRGTRPLTLQDGSARAFLEDGDEVTLSGAAAAPGKPRIGLGSVSGVVLPAP
jgi:fumarylacetoacetase